ncbi:hypothetical protein GH714_039343 [Hevea brasiliensis]|uniref:Pentacotripeptide-repeat region of PRORP domain-containing protein n=1 Tax=Hevea brasiliensis TaxID=3981 RepID=A0A6A6KEH7_HEVBR|nr:hypothetical protein GH714_039343 [Hevea brasiliensis]
MNPIQNPHCYTIPIQTSIMPRKATNIHFPEKPASDFNFQGNQTFPESEQVKFTTLTSQDTVLTRTNAIDTLLSHRNDPMSALTYFNRLERTRKFVRSLDSLCVLLHILTRSSETSRRAQNLLNRFISGDSGPMPTVLVDHLIETAKRFDFESDSRVYNYLLNSYVRANKLNDAVDCFNRMIGGNIFPWVPFLNIFLSALVRNNMICETQKVYNEMVLKGLHGDLFTVHIMMRASLKENKHEEAKKFFSNAKDRGMELDAAVYSMVIQAFCKNSDVNLACGLLSEMRDKGWVPSEGTFTSVILACVKQGNMAEALRLKTR